MTPLPLYASEPQGTVTGRDGKAYQVVRGVSREAADQIKEHSLDESDKALQTGTSDHKRFGLGSYEEWYAKERYPYVLLDEGKLAALIWYGPEPIPDGTEGEWDTIAFRSYPPYRGAGLMSAFSALVMDEHARDFPARRLWLETDVGNEAGLALYQKLGFAEKTRIKDGKRVMMVGS